LYLVIKSASQSLELLSNNYEALQNGRVFFNYQIYVIKVSLPSRTRAAVDA
jgi:hypothetical protein